MNGEYVVVANDGTVIVRGRITIGDPGQPNTVSGGAPQQPLRGGSYTLGFGDFFCPSCGIEHPLDAPCYQSRGTDVTPTLLPDQTVATPQGTFTITGFTGEQVNVDNLSFDRFVLPEGEQVPCVKVGEYGCEHWVNAGWLSFGYLICCPSCFDPIKGKAEG